MKFGIRKPSFRRSFKARTTGRVKRAAKRAVNPFYGKKGVGLVRNPKRSIYNWVYRRTTVGVNPLSLLSPQPKARKAARRQSPAVSAPTPDAISLPLEGAIRVVGPQESGLTFPIWWLAGAILLTLAAFGTDGVSLILAAPCAYLVWRTTQSPRYIGLQRIRSSEANPSAESDAVVRNAASIAPDSWTVQREAGLYFRERALPHETMQYLAEAARMFPGDKRMYAALIADAGTDAGEFDYVVKLLDPYLASGDPDNDDLDAALVSALAYAVLKKGDAARALEVVGRLPLRRRNLDQPLLVGLCVRAEAKHALGKKADAKRDLDRVYAADPSFPMIAEVEAALSS